MYAADAAGTSGVALRYHLRVDDRTDDRTTDTPAAGARPGAALHVANLVALLVPGLAGLAGWFALRDDPRIAWLDPRRGSPHFWIIAVAGVVATAAGIADWRYHRRGDRVVGLAERRVEFFALACGGAPLFAVMATATFAERPSVWLVPALGLAMATIVGICYDELTFHRRCTREETMYHRGLTLGMGTAWLAWVHGCFVAGAAGA